VNTSRQGSRLLRAARGMYYGTLEGPSEKYGNSPSGQEESSRLFGLMDIALMGTRRGFTVCSILSGGRNRLALRLHVEIGRIPVEPNTSLINK
jgi:hypothetical protein